MSVFYSDRRISAQDRKKGIESFLRTIASRFGIKIEFNGSPSTDGKTVWLGDLDPDDEDFEAFALGHGIHEMMHVVDTDAGLLPAARSEGPLVMALLNVFEDVRIDSLGEKRFRGYRLWREELADTLLRRGRHRAGSIDSLSLGEAFALWLHVRALAELRYEWAQNVLGALRERMSAHLPQSLIHELEEDAIGAAGLQSTKQALDLARSIVSRLKNHARRNMPAAEANDAARCKGRSSALEHCSRSEPSAQEKAAESISKPAEKSIEKFLKTISDDAQRAAAGKTNADEDNASVARQSSSSGWLEGSSFDQAEGIEAGLWPMDTDDPYLRRDALEYRSAFADVMPRTHALARRFSQLLRTEGESDCGSSQDGQELAGDWLNRLAQKESALFAAPAPEKNISAEVALLLDRSGSMGIKTMTQAKSITAALVLALKAIDGCKMRAAVFPGPSPIEKVSLAVLDDEPAAKSLERLSVIGAYGSTPIAEALKWALASFSASRARDKLLVIITDGRFPKEFAHAAEEGLARNGIELALLSIEADNAGIARNWVRIDSVADIEQAMIKLLSATRFRQSLQQA